MSKQYSLDKAQRSKFKGLQQRNRKMYERQVATQMIPSCHDAITMRAERMPDGPNIGNICPNVVRKPT